jgi:ABC-2 type transport system ATP-binding protein
MLTSHYMEDIEALCRRVIVIDHGRIMFDGPLSAIVERFSTHKIIGLTFSEPAGCDFSVAGELIERTERGVKLRVPRARVTDVARDLLATCRVHDISVEDPPVEDVIRQLFAEQVRVG